MKCPRCWEQHFVKNGIVRGKQRYKCKECQCNYITDDPSKVKFSVKVNALRLYLEWLWFRSIGRFLWVSDTSVRRWIRMFWEIAEALQQEKVQMIQSVWQLELDELWHFVEKKLTNSGYGLVVKSEQQNFWHLLVDLVEWKEDGSFGIKSNISK